MKTRYADDTDLPIVGEMYIAALKELKEDFTEEKALDYVLKCWAMAPCILLLKKGEIIGFAGLRVYLREISGKKFIRDYMFYTRPEHRGVSSWRTLCKAVQEVSKKFGIPFVGEHRLTGDVDAHLRLIRMAGAKPYAILTLYGEIDER